MKFKPVFIDGSAGRLFAIYYSAAPDKPCSGDVVFLYPFAEEMNRSRRTANVLAQRLSTLGYGVLLLDLFGCGDSAGDFVDARWEIWRHDVTAALGWLSRRSRRPVSLIGHRLGGLLAMDVAVQRPAALERVVLWHPVTNGATMLAQFLRIRLAASLDRDREARESTRELLDLLADGQCIEVGGYEISPELAQALDTLRLEPLGPQCGTLIDWLEVVPDAAQSLSPAASRIVDAWQAAGVRVDAQAVVDQPFWALQETTIAPALLAATWKIFEDCVA